MKQKSISESMRIAPVALAVVLLATLGILALRVHACEPVGDDGVLSEEQKQNRSRCIQAENQVPKKEELSDVFFDKAATMKEELQLRKIDREKRVEGYKAKFSAQKQVRLGQFVERIATRMYAAIDRLEQIADRVLKRLELTEKEKGVDLTEARNELEKVYLAIYDARNFVALFGAISADAITSDTPSEQVAEIREAVALSKDSIMVIHATLSSTVQLIKASSTVAEEDPEAEEMFPEEDVEVTE